MSNDLSQAVADVNQLGKLFQSVITLANVVENADSVSELEATRRRNVATLDAQIAERRDSVQLLLSQEQEISQRFLEQGELLTKQKAAVEQEASDKISAAIVEATVIINKAKDEVEALEAVKASIKADTDSLTLEKSKVEGELADVSGKLKAVKDELRAIAG